MLENRGFMVISRELIGAWSQRPRHLHLCKTTLNVRRRRPCHPEASLALAEIRAKDMDLGRRGIARGDAETPLLSWCNLWRLIEGD